MLKVRLAGNHVGLLKMAKEKYKFFLNPHIGTAFSTCPNCSSKTKQKKLPLAILLEKQKTFFLLNKTCRLCPSCELLIAKKWEIEPMICSFLGRQKIKESDYSIIGTVDKKGSELGFQSGDEAAKTIRRIVLFKDWCDFTCGGWEFADDKKGD